MNRGHGGGAARTRAALATVVAALALPAPAQADEFVNVFEWGVSPPVVEVEVGDAVHFTNWSGLPTAIASTNGLFSSGVLGPGAGYSVEMTVPGSHPYATASLPDVEARIDVVIRQLDGPPDAPVADHLPDLPFPPLRLEDVDLHPVFGIETARTRLVLGFEADATVAEANDVLASTGVRVLGAIPELGLVLARTDDWGEGEFLPLTNALESLRGQEAVEFAALDPLVEDDAVPAQAETAVSTQGWTWDFPGTGANWGLESSRFPQAWNLLETVRRRANDIATGVVDSGFDAHPDLPLDFTPICRGVVPALASCTSTDASDHGNHVAGIIGGSYDNVATATPLRTLGVSGTNPTARMRGVSGADGATLTASLANTIQAMNLLLGAAAAGEVDNLRVINFSQGASRFSSRTVTIGSSNFAWVNWWDNHLAPDCGPGPADDGVAGSGWCTPDTDDTWITERTNLGMAARTVAERASTQNVIIVQSAGNAGARFCLPPLGTPLWTNALPTSAQPTALLPCTAPAVLTPVRTWNTGPFSWASLPGNWTSPGANPIIVVENINSTLARSASSNIGGDISAPGDQIFSTITGGAYDFMGGTSMAAPHVTGLIGYLLAFDPTLTIDDVRTALTRWSASDTSGGATSRIDAYASLMALAGSTKAMVDVNDPSPDGNRRQTPLAAGETGPPVLDTTSGPGFTRTAPDGLVDMRDFRRFRDAWLQTCVQATDALSRVGCPAAADIDLDGGASHPKKDLNFDRCVYVPSATANDPNACVTTETTYSRFDFNGDGWVARSLTSGVPQPLPVEGSVATTDAELTDLGVLTSVWQPGDSYVEGWEPAALDGLLESGELHIHGERFFAAGADEVELTFRNADSGETYPPRTLARGDETFIHTLPAGARIQITGSATAGGESIQSTQTVPPLEAGEDRRLDLCLLDFDLSANRTTVLAGATVGVGIVGTLAGCEGDDVENKAVTFTLEPAVENGATLSAGSALTGPDGRALTTFDAGDVVGGYTVSASVQLGGGRTLADELQIEVVPALKVAYVWRQEILEWSESGSSRWGPPVDPLLPDCVNAGVPYCIDSFTLAPAEPFNALEREGLISGLGNALTLSEEVAPSPNSARQSWTLTNPDGTSPRSDEQVVQWQVADDQLTRYTDFALPSTVRTRDDAEGIRLFGLRAVAGLGYLHDAALVDPPAGATPVELWFTTGRMLLQPRGDGSALQYAPRTTVPILFPRRLDGSFAPYNYCQTVEYDLTSERGYWNPSTSEWVRGATDQGRKTTFTPGDRPMPVGPGRLRVRYSFGAVAAYGSEDPVAVLPACAATSPPDASFEVDAPFEEGRMQVFRSTSTDPENDIVAWEWNFGDGTVVSGVPNSFGFQAHLFKDDGFHEVALTVTDSEGRSDTATQTVTVVNLPPEATFEDAAGQVGQPVDVPFSVWDPSEEDSRALQVEITLGGTTLLSTTREAGFSTFRVSGLAEGVHTLTLRVEDDDGAAATDTATVTVTLDPPPPPPDPPPPTPTCDPGVALDSEEQLFLGLVNAYRAQSGLASVGVSPTLTRAAERHANDMATNDHFDHTGTDGSTPFQRAQDANYPGETVSENLFFGSPRAQDALVSWKSSTTGHNENMLQPDWRAVGIARQFGSGKWFWATSYGDFLDCPGGGAGEGSGGVLTATAPADAGEAAPRSLFAAAAAEPVAAAVLLPYDPLAAFTISNVQPRENQPLTVVNRSRDAAGAPIAATLQYGDGQVAELAPDAAVEIRLPGQSQELVLTATDAGGRDSRIERQLWVEPLRPPTIQYLGETFGAVGKPLAVGARVRSPWDDTPLAGIPVTFTLGPASVTATTGADGVASASLVLTGVTAGSQFLRLTTPAGDDLTAGNTSAFVTVVANNPPIAKPGGPYVTGEGATLLLDGGLSTDPDPGDSGGLTYAWDYDGDGAFDDAQGATPPELEWDEIRVRICGGVCATDTPYPLALQVTDRWGDSHSAATSVSFTGDFGLILVGGTITIVPGSSNSVGVTVVGSAGWTEPVTLSVTGLPAGVTATFSRNPVTPTGTSVLTLTASSSVETGTFPVRVTGTGGGVTHETGEDVTVAFGLIPICFGSYTGTVVDAATGAPVPSVQLRLLSASGGAVTDENGRYVFRNVPLGFNNAPRTHFVRTIHTDYWDKQLPAEAVCRGVTRLDFQVIRKQTGRLAGLVVDRDTRAPLPGATLSAFDGPSAQTGPDGRYAIDLPLHPDNQPRFYTYKAEAPGYWFQERSVTVDAAAPQELDYELVRKCQGTIRGGVVRVQQTNAVVANSVVRLQLTTFFFVSVTTNAAGEYSFNRPVDLGYNNTPIGYPVQAFPPPGSPVGSASGFSTFVLDECGDEASTDILISVPVENNGAMEGVVRDEETLEPIAGANLRACGFACFETATGADGTYRFPKLQVGFDSQLTRTYTLQASKTGYFTAFSSSQTVTANETTRADMVLLRQKFARLEGTVTDLVSGAPIPDAAIQSLPFGCAFEVICAISNREGLYLDPTVPLGTRNAPTFRNFQVSATGYWPVTRGSTFTAETTSVVDVQLLKECSAARVVGTVVNAETQAPINGALVQGGGRSTLTDVTGRFTLEGLRAGSNNAPLGVSITASASGFFSQTKTITIYCGATIVVDFGSRESALGTIVGTITNADTGAPIADVFVATEFGRTATTDASGNYRFDQVPLGDLNSDRAWKITAFPTGFKPQTKTVIAQASVEVRGDFAFSVFGNAKPVADAGSAETDEEQPKAFVLTGSDADGDPLTFHVMRFPAHGSISGSAPNLQYRPDLNYTGPDSLEFVVNDGLDNSERATVTFDVKPVNDSPAAFQDLFDTGVDVPLRIPFADLTANDVDVDGDALTVTDVFSGPTFQVEPGDGFVLVTPPPGFESPTPAFAFNYRVEDGSGGTSFGSVFVRVTRLPLAPVCSPASFAAEIDVPLDGSVTCTDGNGDALTYELVSGPAEGFLVLRADGTFTFTPPPGFAGTTSFGFRATDGTLTSEPATATIVVAAANAPPVAADVAVSTDEDTPVAVTLAATDPDGDTLTLTHGTPANGSFDGTTYTPAADFHGTDSFTYTADDGVATDDGTVTITVRPVNDAPQPVDDSAPTPEDTAVTGNVLANDGDVDGDTLTAALEAGPQHGSVTLAPDGGFTYTPAANYAGPDEFSYRASDGAAGAVAAVRITVTPVEDDPTAADDAFSTDEDTAVSGTVLANDADPEGGALAATMLDPPAHGTLALGTNGLFTYTPAANFHGGDSFTYTATDPAGRSATATARIEVRPVNDPPTAQDVAAATDEDAPLDLLVGGADVDGDRLALEWTQPAHGSYDGSRYTPAADFAGGDSFTYTVRDPSGESATATVTIDVRPVNDAPVATDVSVETDEDVPLSISFSSTDVDGGEPVFAPVTAPQHGTWDGTTYTPAPNYHGPDSFAFLVSDGVGGSDVGTVEITVRPVNDAPAVADRSVATDEDTPLPIELAGTDVDGDPLTIATTQPAHGDYANGVYTPRANYFGTDTFDYTASDGQGGSDTAAVMIEVRPVNDPPTVALAAAEAVDEGAAPVQLTAAASDPDGGDSLTFAWTAGSGTLTPAGATAGYTNDDGPRVDTVTVTVSDGSESASSSAEIAVRNVAPTAAAGPDVASFWSLPLLFAGAATDPSSADTAAGFAAEWLFTDGTPAVAGLTARHTFTQPGTYTATFRAADKDGGSDDDSATVTIAKRPTSLAYTGPATATFGLRTLTARLADTVDAATADLAGRTIVFRLETRVFEGVTDPDGVATVTSVLPLSSGRLEVEFAGDDRYLGSSTPAELTIASTQGKITGGGLRSLDHPGRGGFNVLGPEKGDLQWQNGSLNFHAQTLTALGIAADGRSAWFAGLGRDGREFVAYVEDNGEPGRTDVFKLWIAGTLQTPGDGRLSGGNIQIHR